MSSLFGQVFNGNPLQNMYTMNNIGFGVSEGQYYAQAGMQFVNLLANSIFARNDEDTTPAPSTPAKPAATTPNANKITELKQKRANADAEVDKEKPDLKEAIKTAEANVRSYDKNTKIVSDCTTKIDANNTKISELKSKKQEIPANADDTTRKSIEDTNNNLQKQIEELEKRNKELETTRDKAQQELDKLGDPKVELEAAKKAREAAVKEFITKIDAEIKKLEDEDNLYKQN